MHETIIMALQAKEQPTNLLISKPLYTSLRVIYQSQGEEALKEMLSQLDELAVGDLEKALKGEPTPSLIG